LIATGLTISGDPSPGSVAEVQEYAFLHAFRGPGGKGRRAGFQTPGHHTRQGPRAPEHRDRIIAAARTGHAVPAVGHQLSKKSQRPFQGADGTDAHPGGFPASGFTGEVVIKSDGTVEIGQRNFQGPGDGFQRFLGQISVPVLERMKEGKEGSRLAGPCLDDLLVCPYSHQGLQAGERPPDIPEGDRTVRE